MEAKLLKCDNETSDGQLWILHGDPRALSICDKFVPGKFAIGISKCSDDLSDRQSMQSRS